MQRYSTHIIRVLKAHGLEFSYDSWNSIVYGLSASTSGDIFSLFQLKDEIITSFAVFQPKVPSSLVEKVTGYLDGINSQSTGGYFYIDDTLCRVVYCVEYAICRGMESWAFELFCLRWLEQFSCCRQILFWLITGYIAENTGQDIA